MVRLYGDRIKTKEGAIMQTINIVLLIGVFYLLWDNNRLYRKAKRYEKWVLMLDKQICEPKVKDDETH